MEFNIEYNKIQFVPIPSNIAIKLIPDEHEKSINKIKKEIEIFESLFECYSQNL